MSGLLQPLQGSHICKGNDHLMCSSADSVPMSHPQRTSMGTREAKHQIENNLTMNNSTGKVLVSTISKFKAFTHDAFIVNTQENYTARDLMAALLMHLLQVTEIVVMEEVGKVHLETHRQHRAQT